MVKTSIDRRIKDICAQNWSSELYTNSVCVNYRIFKTEPGIEKYLKINENLRTYLTKFRCRNHRLPVSSHRFNNSSRMLIIHQEMLYR